MHFVTGGAFNGKRKWVKDHYSEYLSKQWHCFYEEVHLPELTASTVVIEGVEQWVKAELKQLRKAETVREKWKQQLQLLADWEKEDLNRKLVLIGNDLSKGIVPMDSFLRNWRDVTGWCYQDIVHQSERVDIIWYGLNQQLK
ncbi:adenosyl cobinamide kinase/adenosyl cobinamide phosphate guanylyltransferase [Oikeobacillus pervagus]|uniref:Adenosyl cobinamide kinase/adenosyl cobinamide phosphate guanylyltransferase n=1 Tax=Oikeobacillus pervagus TaxID=1325931 RepID=A0AAJ1T5U6_9BACI|nr:bifunctional adenosylcobinamide kinase/adenosylcobinamide-phosphate guanylyltransferase [Oikeobacillus pervagus]MDQ0216414.1 adenosyl cobinamide kinase/adenosyl cobinamide phosphate guanylyltransferase [Oikeobacillus pervagus]